MFLPTKFISGCRPDGTPNLSHAWARTIDGAQGGTWTQVHLLGTPALDHYTGYVGQSRGRQPTHTWNTRPEPDHPTRLLADQRTPTTSSRTLSVAPNRRRSPPPTTRGPSTGTSATNATPTPPSSWVDHPMRAATRRRAPRLARGEHEYRWACAELAQRQAERARTGPAHPAAAWRTADIARADQAVDYAELRLARTTNELDHRARGIARHTAAAAGRSRWDREHSWRLNRVAEIDDTLAHHWADIVLRAVRADDPLAFGIQRLRDARATYYDDHQRIIDTLPPDPRNALTRAQTDRARCQQRMRDAEQRLRSARLAVEHARPPRWRRPDTPATARAHPELRAAEASLMAARDAATASEQRLTEAQRGVAIGDQSVAKATTQRSRLTAAIHDLDTALDLTRPERVAAAATNPRSDPWRILGPPPHTRGGLAAWCGIAEHIEAQHDRDATAITVRREVELPHCSPGSNNSQAS